MRLLLCGAALVAVTACTATVPDSGAGVGFGNYEDYQRQQAQREAALSGGVLPPPSAVSSETIASGGSVPQQGASVPQGEAERIAAETAAALNSGVAPLQADPSNPAPVAVNAAGISEENNFDNVSTLRSIESDAQRIAANRAQYQVVQPTALPSRVNTGPNIVDYALSTTNVRGQSVYRRSTLSGQSRFERNCARYPSPDLAQADFLQSGGPERDRMGLDPDGDGFACGWDPAPFRKARG